MSSRTFKWRGAKEKRNENKRNKTKDLAALTESLQNSKSAMVVSFTKRDGHKGSGISQQLA